MTSEAQALISHLYWSLAYKQTQGKGVTLSMGPSRTEGVPEETKI